MRMVTINNKKVAEEDMKRYFKEDGDDGFNPSWNKMVIDKTIKHNEELRVAKQKAHVEAIRERASAVASFFTSKYIDSSNPDIAKYLGKRNLAYLRGQKIAAILKGKYTKLVEINN